MANTQNSTHNHPSQEASIKGGEHSHSGSTNTGSKQGGSGSHEGQVKGGEHSHSGSK